MTTTAPTAKPSTYSVKLGGTERALGSRVSVAVVERFGDESGGGEFIIGAMDVEIVGFGAHWSDQTHGRSGYYYEVKPLSPMPEKEGHVYALSC